MVDIDEVMRKQVEARAKLRDIDAELNDGLLVEVCKIFGHSLYMRINHRDPERAAYELRQVQSILKEVVWPDADEQLNHYYLLPKAAERVGLSIVTLRRYIKSGRLPATKVGKNYRVSEKDLQKLAGGVAYVR